MSEIKNYLQYPSNTLKYTTSVLYWMYNKLFFDNHFCMQNNLNMMIKILNTIYLLYAVLFPSIISKGLPTFCLSLLV